MDEELEEIYRQVADQISREDFLGRVDEKVALMAGLCDRRTAAMLVARDLGAMEVSTKIGSIRPEMGNVAFSGKVQSISEIREFKRSDGSIGRVANLTLADDTGTVRVALWDERCDLIKSGDLAVDQCLKVRGQAKEGYLGTEVSLGRDGNIVESDMDIRPRDVHYTISEIKGEMSAINLVAQIVDAGSVREFLRKDGGKGQVRSVLLGDETGKISLTLWNEQALIQLQKGETVEIQNGSSRERYGMVEIQTGSYSVVQKSSKSVSYQEKITPISDLKAGLIASVSGFVTGLGETREFSREDGKKGRVASIYLSDDTGRIKVTLWADHVDLLAGLDIGCKSEIIDAQVKNGWNEELELSCGWRTKITFAPPG